MMNTKFNLRRIVGGVIFAFLFIPFVVSGQDEKIQEKEINDEPAYKYLTYMKFQEALPLEGFKSEAYRVYFKDSDSLISTARPGYGFEIGSMFLFGIKPLREKAFLGLDATWFEFYYNNIDRHPRNEASSQIESSPDNLSSYQTSPYIFFGTKLGLSFSLNPVKDLSIDLYYKINPLVSRTGLYYNGGSVFFNNRINFDVVNSAGINIRYYYFLFGVEYTSGQLYYKSDYFAPDMKLEMLKINLGLYFE